MSKNSEVSLPCRDVFNGPPDVHHPHRYSADKIQHCKPATIALGLAKDLNSIVPIRKLYLLRNSLSAIMYIHICIYNNILYNYIVK